MTDRIRRKRALDSAPTADALVRILDIVARAAPSLTADQLRTIEHQVRREIGAERHYIAGPGALDRSQRHQQIRQAVASGLTHSQTAARFGLTRQGVWKICSAAA